MSLATLQQMSHLNVTAFAGAIAY